MAITNVGYDGTINEPGWAKLQAFLGQRYAFGSAADFAPTTVVGVDRTVQLAAGSAAGHGVLVISDAPISVQSPVLASGTRWDTVVLRRDWQTNTSSVVVITGTSTEQLAAGLNANPGIIDDEPLALVQITSGQQLPTAIRDLRPNVMDATKHDVGDLFVCAAATAPFGTVPAQGQELSRAQYSRLFARIGTTHGAGNGTTTFNAPNVKGKVIVGLDPADATLDAIGETGGAKTHTLSAAETPSHAHGMTHNHPSSTNNSGQHNHAVQIGVVAVAGGIDYVVRSEYGTPGVATSDAGDHGHVVTTGNSAKTTTDATGGGAAHNNMQPYIAELVCIQV
jgi:microcystin-dependent protein